MEYFKFCFKFENFYGIFGFTFNFNISNKQVLNNQLKFVMDLVLPETWVFGRVESKFNYVHMAFLHFFAIFEDEC